MLLVISRKNLLFYQQSPCSHAFYSAVGRCSRRGQSTLVSFRDNPSVQCTAQPIRLLSLPSTLLTPRISTSHSLCGVSCCRFLSNAPFTEKKEASTALAPDIQRKPDSESVEQKWASCTSLSRITNDQWHEITGNYTCRLINRKTFDKFCVRLNNSRDSLVFPGFARTGDYIAQDPVSLRLVKLEDLTASQCYPGDAAQSCGLFGYNTISSKNDVVVLVSDEWSAMFVHQHSGLPTVAVPCQPDEFESQVLRLLASFRKVIVWFPPDLIERAKSYMTLLGPERCYFVSPSLLKNLTIKEYYMKPPKRSLTVLECLAQCLRMFHPCISSVNDLRTTVFDYVYRQGLCQGLAQWNRLSVLNSYLGGLRAGELTVFSGPTGSGKTTFISLYSLDLCEQLEKQVNTLWCSFEVGTARLIHVMLQQLNSRKIDETVPQEEMEVMYDRLATLPLHFTRFNGSFEFRDVIKAIEHHIEICDIRHVVVDNLQFLASAVDQQQTDRFLIQDKVFGEFRRIATEKGVHLTLVIHPRKEVDSGQLTLNSLYGGVKASQEADNVYVLQVRHTVEPCGTPKISRYFQILKNRRMGELEIGNRLELKFNHETLSHRIVKHIDSAFLKKVVRTKS